MTQVKWVVAHLELLVAYGLKALALLIHHLQLLPKARVYRLFTLEYTVRSGVALRHDALRVAHGAGQLSQHK